MFERRSPRWVAVSVGLHVLIVVALAQIMFRYPLGQLLGIPEPEVAQERLQYIQLPRQPTEHSGAMESAASTPSAAPAALQMPTTVPTTVPTPMPADSSRAEAAGGTGDGFGVTGSGLATGLVPRQPDPRIALGPGRIARTPRTVAEDVDSIVRLAVGIANDSLGLYARQNKLPEWVRRGKNGEAWGLDSSAIYLGKVKIPTALLALLPFNMQSRVGPIEARSMAYIRRDIMENAQRSISEDEFRASVKRIRERKEREKRQKQLAADTKGTQTPQH